MVDQLVDVDTLGPALVTATGDERWAQPSPSLISGGKSNLTYLLTSPAGELVFRRPPSGNVLATAHDMGREVRVQRALADTPIPVPTIVLDDAGDLLGYPFYVMNRVAGQVIRDQLPDGYASTEAERHRMGIALVDTLAALHAVDYQAVGLDKHGRPDGYMQRQLARWGKQWEATRSSADHPVEELRARLAESLPPQSDTTIVHGDFRLDNCVMDAGDPGRVAAVLDWEMSTIGDPLSDLGLLLFYWVEPGEGQSDLTPTVVDLPGFPTRAELRERYAEVSGRDISHLPFYEAFAHFKSAAIAQGIDVRVKAGVMGGQDFGDLSETVLMVAERGLDRLRNSQ
ncbi:aminoglycoside phosphotransferase (APT) family kinase protein [Branchiibius hedensis]|uniref:Predicted kinase, aminoglycoside phosphotransferase (APT) family n=1 Tax=Branchiibius hedensis TaxID=672460 RepID=A0A2Y8ZT23_9MICO|nr:phosphotransferase family protein [Branchiibius hedensis]PWJ24572.1 aminoglycoside phosphotransferase (APT) family kinase protein [Branchiibius hedensis]SSA33389.1 Predicted kinase, aminoglycoside phosphotransferase (APT) family [Branchiibius hedensis]